MVTSKLAKDVLSDIAADKVGAGVDDGMFGDILETRDDETESDMEAAGEDETFSPGWHLLVAKLISETFPGRVEAIEEAPNKEPGFTLCIADFTSTLLVVETGISFGSMVESAEFLFILVSVC